MPPKRAITLGASLRGMWMICETSRLNLKPSADRTVIVDRLASSWCASVLPVAQLSTTLAVGTLVTLCVYGLIGYLPGSSGSTHTPLSPRVTRLPCRKASPGHVLALLADVGDDHADVGDRHLGHVDHLDGGEARVDEVAARQQHLLLQALAALAIDERLRVLEHVVAFDDRPGDFT